MRADRAHSTSGQQWTGPRYTTQHRDRRMPLRLPLVSLVVQALLVLGCFLEWGLGYNNYWGYDYREQSLTPIPRVI